MERSKKKKILKSVLLGMAGALVTAGICLIIFLPVTYNLDDSLIKTNSSYNVGVIDKNGYTTLVKTDAAGNFTDETFKVIGFTDTHLDHKKEKSNIAFNYIVRNISAEKPDLVVFVGDNVTSSFNRRRAKQLAKTMEKLGVYWTLVLGNHEGDNIWSISRKAMVKLFARYPHCLIDASEKTLADGTKVSGNGNFVINLMRADGTITQSLYFIDGGAYMSDDDLKKYADEITDLKHNDYDYVKESQIEWYKETVRDIEKLNGTPVPSVIYDHIPLPEYRTAYEEITGETDIVTEGALNCNVPNENGTELIYGRRYEAICYSGHNSGFFDAILEMGSTHTFVCGHDHVNDFIVKYKGVTLAYNNTSGYSSYNLVSKQISDKLQQGFTRYLFDAQGGLNMESVSNADLYPGEQDEIKKLY